MSIEFDTTPNEIVLYAHCTNCEMERPTNVSPSDWVMLEVGLTRDQEHLQVWCKRHDMNIKVFHLAEKFDFTCGGNCDH